ncbi:pentachlorophenol 4-monooxygenase [Aspergillus undulatus]|uniref:pentachlorophenol 4-monooxygenase n=1 Tax=Aspergillus undulatus TaxID=1810928 RepID=UPI003CCE113E
MSSCLNTDVLICGGGPVGLIVAYSLARQGVSSLLVEQHDKAQQDMYGRATTLYPRTLEMLDQLDLLEDLNQIGYVGRNSVTYKDGKRVTSRGWHTMFQHMNGTYLDYCLNIRQKYSEEVFRNAYKKLGGDIWVNWKLETFSVDHKSDNDYKASSQIRNLKSGELTVVKSKYVVGADGGHSTVRRLANIPFEGDRTNHRWVRMDGHFKTNMPDADLGWASIESKHHGNVLWVQLDHGAKRIGFAMTDEMMAKYGDRLTEDDAKKEAVKAMEPFTLEFETLDWWTLYSINQRVADSFISNDRIILAGDAGHTHSSGAAQGMNTGVHDAVNLSWKLGGTIKNWYTKNILNTYDGERRSAAHRLIELDKAFSATISGHIPETHRGLYADANELFGKLFDETIQFTMGLGIHYEESLLSKPTTVGMITAGWRAPDALVYPPGAHLPVRLFTLTKNRGQWSVLIFAGQPSDTQAGLTTAVETLSAFAATLPQGMVRFLTVVGQNIAEGDKLFSIPKLGYICFDKDQSAHAAYAISPGRGAVVVLRPDGILAHATTLDDIDSATEFLSSLPPTASL